MRSPRRQRSPIETAALVGFWVALLLAAAAQAFAAYSSERVIRTEAEAFEQATFLVEVERLRVLVADEAANARALLLTRDVRYQLEMDEDGRAIQAAFASLDLHGHTPEGRARVGRLQSAVREHDVAIHAAVAREAAGGAPAEIATEFVREVEPKWSAVEATMNELSSYKGQLLQRSLETVTSVTAHARELSVASVALMLLLGAAFGALALRRIHALVEADAAARRAAEALAAELGQQAREVVAALGEMREAKERAEARLAELERAAGGAA